MRIFLALSIVLLASCGQEQPTETEPPEMIPTQETTGTGGMVSSDQAVQLIEYAVRMPQNLKAGAQAFHIANAGREIHSFEVEGNGVHAALPSPLSAGSETHFEVDLPPGTYTVYCPVKGHRERGMVTQITVQ